LLPLWLDLFFRLAVAEVRAVVVAAVRHPHQIREIDSWFL
jgi:hypothetical protein